MEIKLRRRRRYCNCSSQLLLKYEGFSICMVIQQLTFVSNLTVPLQFGKCVNNETKKKRVPCLMFEAKAATTHHKVPCIYIKTNKIKKNAETMKQAGLELTSAALSRSKRSHGRYDSDWNRHRKVELTCLDSRAIDSYRSWPSLFASLRNTLSGGLAECL